MSEKLPPLNSVKACPKCERPTLDTHIRRGARYNYITAWAGRPNTAPPGCADEHIARTCRSCGYLWREACAEVKA